MARAVHQAAEAAVRQAELNLSYTTVAAPVAGISRRAVKSEGNLITAGDESLLTSIHQSNPMWVRFSLSESDMARLPGGRLTQETVTGVELKLPDGSVYPRDRPAQLFSPAALIRPSAPSSFAPSSTIRTARCCPASSFAPAFWPENGKGSFWCRRRR